jgi:hypothetical protein
MLTPFFVMLMLFTFSVMALKMTDTYLGRDKKALTASPTPKAIESRHEVFDCAVYDQSLWEAKLIEAGIMDRADRVLCDDKECKLCKDERAHRQSLLNQTREERSQEFWRGQRLKKETEAYRSKVNKWVEKNPTARINRRYNPRKDTVEVQVMTGDGKIVRTEYLCDDLNYGEVTVDQLLGDFIHVDHMLDMATIHLPKKGTPSTGPR